MKLRFNTETSEEQITPLFDEYPSLLSALQSFETGVFLFAHSWYPNALLLVVSGIEKALVAHHRLENRTIGIISHVDALKQRIGAQIQVSKSSNGYGTLEVLSAN